VTQEFSIGMESFKILLRGDAPVQNYCQIFWVHCTDFDFKEAENTKLNFTHYEINVIPKLYQVKN
jgi:hypothetical protein